MTLPRPSRLWRLMRGRSWALGARRGVLILLYHRVASVDWDPWQLCVSPRHFAEQLEAVRRHATVLSLAALVAALAANRLPRRGVVLTFDDGYADNLESARPLLERYDVPATVFLATGAIGSGAEFWWDELEQLVVQPGASAGLRLTVDGRRHVVRAAGPASGRDAAYRTLWQVLQPLPADRRRCALDELWSQAGTRPTVRASHRTLSAAEAADLGADGLVSLGAHTVTHPNLARLPAAEQRIEIEQSKAACEALSRRPAMAFAYPHGGQSGETARLVRAAGFACACASDLDLVGGSADPFVLPRVAVGDWDGETFARRLARAFL